MNQQGITDPTLLSNPRMFIPQQSEIIYEIYIQTRNSIAEDFLIWLDNVLIKEMLNYDGFRAAKLYTLINDDSQSRTKKYTYYSLQFLVDSIDLLNSYLTNYGDKFRMDASAKYGKQFTEERRILSFQKFYTYDATFNPNTNTVTDLSSNPFLTTEPIAYQQETPESKKKKGIMTDIKAFFGFNRKREANLLVDNSNVGNLAPNPILGKNVSEMVFSQVQPEPNIENRDKNLCFGKNVTDINPIPSVGRSYVNVIDNNNAVAGSGFANDNINIPKVIPSSNLSNEPYGKNLNTNNNNFVYDANNPNQNQNIIREANLASSSNPVNLTFSSREQIHGTTDTSNLRNESNLASDFQSKNIITSSSQPKDQSTTSNVSNRGANTGSSQQTPKSDFTYEFEKEGFKGTENSRHGFPQQSGDDKEQVWSKDFLESVQSGNKDFPRKDIHRDVDYDYIRKAINKETYVGASEINKDRDLINRNLIKNKDKDKPRENVVVEQTTEVKDINNNQKYLSKDVFVGTIDKDKLQHIEKDFKKDIFTSPSDGDYAVAYDYEEKENDVNLINRNIGHQDRFGSGLEKKEKFTGKDLEYNKNLSSNKNVIGEQRIHGGGIDDVI